LLALALEWIIVALPVPLLSLSLSLAVALSLILAWAVGGLRFSGETILTSLFNIADVMDRQKMCGLGRWIFSLRNWKKSTDNLLSTKQFFSRILAKPRQRTEILQESCKKKKYRC
jgi:hypothetical protein